MQIAWVTDIHLTYVPPANREKFYASLAGLDLGALLIGGDIGEADSVITFLGEIESALRIPIFFVLGNHDFYGSSIARVRAAVSRHSAASSASRWLSEQGVVPLSASTALVGHDSWGDGRLGDFFGAEVLFNDFLHIEELKCRNKQTLLSRLNALGDEAAAAIATRAAEALASYPRVIVLTHVPPFREVCLRDGQPADDQTLPFYACKAVGDRLSEIARAHPDRSLTVLSGHTHSSATAQVLPNLVVYTGAARYGRPVLQRVFEV